MPPNGQLAGLLQLDTLGSLIDDHQHQRRLVTGNKS